MFWVFSNKKRLEEAREETKKGFESVKKDMFSISEWIKHLDLEKNAQKEDISQIKSILSSIKEELEELRERVDVADALGSNNQIKQPFKTNSNLFNKQTADFDVQTGVQTGVQTPNLEQFSVTERAILWILLNSEMKLSYDDLAAMLGKERSTIRGQINTIKSKSESLIEEVVEKNGKKRVFIPEEIKEKMLKKTKVRVNSKKNVKKTKKVSEY
jgi:predicted transcriptional regulator